mmetsp:Transcript_4772/g.8483  ORF Transcript_4772/g.8483 Transcript_4772/m.8483 type:complete len:505 (-) Transcript_4772:252-1766(-)
MERVKRRGGRGRHPCGGSTSLQLRKLGVHHALHVVGLSPHALADLSGANEASLDTNVHVPLFVSHAPGRLLDVSLGLYRACTEASVNLVTSAVQEACVDENATLLGSTDALLQVDGRAALLVHDSELDGVAGQAKKLFHAGEHTLCESNLLGSVLLGLDHVHRASARVALGTLGLLEVMHCSGYGDQCINQAFGNVTASVSKANCVGEQVHTNVAYQKYDAAGENLLAARFGAYKRPVGVKLANKVFATLGELLLKGSFHETGPVTVHLGLVKSINSSHRVLAVCNRGDCRLDHDVVNASSVGCANGARRVNLKDDVKAVVLEEHFSDGGSVHVVARKLLALLQRLLGAVLELYLKLLVCAQGKLGHVAILGASCQGEVGVKYVVAVVKNLCAANGVVALALLRPIGFGEDVGAVHGVHEANPSRVSCVETKACVVHRAHELRTRGARDLGVHVLYVYLERGALRNDVANLAEESIVSSFVNGFALVLQVELINGGLDGVTGAQ